MDRRPGLTRRRALLGGAALLLGAHLMFRPRRPAVAGDTVTVDGRRLHYVRAGSGPPLVLIHGASGTHRDWTFFHMARLTERYEVFAFDRPGIGASDAARGPLGLSGQADLMRAAMAVLGHERVTLVGHSYGGSVALNWAVGSPESVAALVLLAAPSLVWEGSPGRLYDLTNTPVIGWAFSELVPYIASEARIARSIERIFAPQPVPEGFRAHVGIRAAVQPTMFRRNAAMVGALKDDIRQMIPRYDTLTMPIELIHGEDDTIVRNAIHSAPFAEMVPTARLTALPGVGHMPHHARPDLLDTALARVAPV